MTLRHGKATPISNLDLGVGTAPKSPLRALAGQGAAGRLVIDEGYVTVDATTDVDSTYQLVRVPSNAVIKQVWFESEAQTAGKFEIGVYYATDGQLQGKATSLLEANAIYDNFFASDIDCASAVNREDITNLAGHYTLDLRAEPIWQAAGLTADPGGNIDIVATVHTTAVTTGTGKLGIQVAYTIPV
jgi:hypothetical protein